MNPMVALSATNPCHLYDLAVALHARGALGRYHSGYPGWKLHPPAGFPLAAHSARTLVTYGALRLPAWARPASPQLFRWQDDGFDRAVARSLRPADGRSLHAMPGQALATFRAARTLGLRTVLNHASGPVRAQLATLAPEYARAGLAAADFHRFDAAYFAREEAEYSAADYHCVASTLVRDQLRAAGVPAEKIWVVPYGADAARFHPPAAGAPARDPRRVVFAGQLTLRKGLRVLFAALAAVRATYPVELHLYGPVSPDARPELAAVAGAPWLRVHGPVRQAELGAIFRGAGLLVLPSWEEAFGLVVPQALNCGLPCLVSDRVGAADLISPRRNGSVFPAGDADALAREIAWWLEHPATAPFPALTWDEPAQRLIALSSTA